MTMKLYYDPASCAMAAHIALVEAGLPHELERVDLERQLTASGADFRALNPKGHVPVLRMADGGLLTECAVILQYIADQVPHSGLAPPAGTLPRYRLQEWLNFIASDLHRGFTPLFGNHMPDAVNARARAQLARRFDYLTAALADRDWLLGDTFTIADAYLFTILNWVDFVALDLAPWPVLTAYARRAAARPAVRAAMAAEGLPGSARPAHT